MSPTPHPPAELTVPWGRVERFVGQLTHDVRNGLNAIELQLTYLGEICGDPEAAAETKRLRASLAAVTLQLQAVRLATGAVAPTRMDYPAGEFFEDLRERFERLPAAANAAIAWKVDVGRAALAIDPELTMTALLEVLGNALHFGGPSARCTVSVREVDGSTLHIAVAEHCHAPVDTAAWGHTPLQSGRRQAYGLGLFRAARILEAQDGGITAQYSLPEQTLTTSITLPLAAAA